MESFSGVYVKFQLPHGAFHFHVEWEKLLCLKAFLCLKMKGLEISSYMKRYRSYCKAFKMKQSFSETLVVCGNEGSLLGILN